jgi:hypothetical protein
MGTGVFFPGGGVKRQECKADHSHPSSAEVKNAWRYTSNPAVSLYVVVRLVKHRDNFNFYSILNKTACPFSYSSSLPSRGPCALRPVSMLTLPSNFLSAFFLGGGCHSREDFFLNSVYMSPSNLSYNFVHRQSRLCSLLLLFPLYFGICLWNIGHSTHVSKFHCEVSSVLLCLSLKAHISFPKHELRLDTTVQLL